MLDLSEKGLKSWFERLPDDIQSSISDDIPADVEGAGPFAGLIREAEPAQYQELIEGHSELVEKLGRVGRVRLLSFICDRVFPFQTKIFHELLGEEDDEEGSKGIRIMLIEDLKAFNEAIAARVYKSNMDNVALRALQEAAFEQVSPDSPF